MTSPSAPAPGTTGGPDYDSILEDIAVEVRPALVEGRVATYIEPLSRVPREQFGMAVVTVDGRVFTTGAAERPFSIQSISKLFSTTLAIRRVRDELWRRVGREPSGSAFNSLVQLEHERGIPRNPFLNAGALVVADVLLERDPDALANLQAFIQGLAGDAAVEVDPVVAAAELATGYRNQALAAFLKSFGNLRCEVDAVLELYVGQCALAMSCVDLARATLFLAHGGVSPSNGEVVLDASQTKRLNALMLTCGTYDSVGDFAYRVGLPGKSGVGGGIVGVLPGQLAVCVWSPGLGLSGNSLAGTLALELFTTKLGRSIF